MLLPRKGFVRSQGGGGGLRSGGIESNCVKLRKNCGKLRENCDVVSGPPEPSGATALDRWLRILRISLKQSVHGQYNYRMRPSISPWNCSMNRRRRMLSSNLCCRFETVPHCEKKRSTSPPFRCHGDMLQYFAPAPPRPAPRFLFNESDSATSSDWGARDSVSDTDAMLLVQKKKRKKRYRVWRTSKWQLSNTTCSIGPVA